MLIESQLSTSQLRISPIMDYTGEPAVVESLLDEKLISCFRGDLRLVLEVQRGHTNGTWASWCVLYNSQVSAMELTPARGQL